MAGNRAPSVSTYFEHSGGDILVQNVCVPSHLCSKYTYYCCLNWNMGRPGEGYCGIQCLENGKCFICSLWDPPSGAVESIKPIFVSKGNSFTKRFGVEGNGLKYMNFENKWKADQWYSLVVRRWNKNDHTIFGLWVRDLSANGKWIRMVEMDFPLPDIYFETPVACFVEDWHGNGQNARGAKYKDTFNRNKKGEWECLTRGEFYVNQEAACKNWNEHFKVEVNPSDTILMQTGSKTTKPTSQETRVKVSMTNSQGKPNIPPVILESTKFSNTRIEWVLSESSTPQFAYIVKVNGSTIVSDIDSECRHATIVCFKDAVVEVLIEDILGRKVNVEHKYTTACGIS